MIQSNGDDTAKMKPVCIVIIAVDVIDNLRTYVYTYRMDHVITMVY